MFRDPKKMDTPIIPGMNVYYNFTKKHGALKGMTPAEAILIEVDGKNKWKMIIQNIASIRKTQFEVSKITQNPAIETLN